MALRLGSLLRRNDDDRRTSAPSRDAVLRRAPHVLGARQGEEVALLDPRGQRYYALNDVGARAWALLGGDGATAREIADAIDREYAVPDDGSVSVAADVDRLLRDLLHAGLVVDVGAERPAREATR